MKQQIQHISTHQSSKVISLIFLLLSAIIAVPFGIGSLVIGEYAAGFAFFLMPFIYFAFNYIINIVVFFLYNFVAKHFGGFELTLSTQEEA
ncbi:MAG: hypothetical protein KDK65_01300 [Chlamydiia bacterium]|nr:hypothetical protein [Chlamydiia bacterium]